MNFLLLITSILIKLGIQRVDNQVLIGSRAKSIEHRAIIIAALKL